MRFKDIQRPTKEGPIPGYRSQDINELNKHSPYNDPETQLFTKELDSEEKNERYCSECNSRLIYDETMQYWICPYSACKVTIIPESDTPLLMNQDQGLNPFASQYYNPNNSEPDAYFCSFNPDSREPRLNKNYKVTYNSGRVKHIKVDGFPSRLDLHAFDDEED